MKNKHLKNALFFVLLASFTLASCGDNTAKINQKKLDEVVASLVIPTSVEQNFEIAKPYLYEAAITWSTLSTYIEIKDTPQKVEFIFTFSEANLEATIEAEITYQNLKTTKTFPVTIKAIETKSDQEKFDEVVASLQIPTNLGADYQIEKPYLHGANVAWSTSSSLIEINDTNESVEFILFLDEDPHDAQISALITYKEISDTKTFNLTLLPLEDVGPIVEEVKVLYATGFEESDGFVGSTQYQNYVNGSTVGPLPNQFKVLSGNVSATGALDGKLSVLMRYYVSRPTVQPYLQTLFSLNKIKKIEFDAKTAGDYSLDVLSTTELTKPFTLIENITLNNSTNRYSIESDFQDERYFQFKVVPGPNVTTTNNEDTNIDNIVFYGVEKEEIVIPPIGEETPKYDGYYETISEIDVSLLPSRLKTLLNTYTQVNYGEAKTALQKSDLKPGSTTHMYGIYNSSDIPLGWDGGETWQREHVWPCSRMVFNGSGTRPSESSKNQMSDLHNLRAINAGLNQSRNNKYFDAMLGSDTFYPGNDHRGDVARILFYMDTKYDELSLTNMPSGQTEMGNLSELIKWHYLDPVDQFEINRNNEIFKIQNNRNPFIDHAELVSYLYPVN